MLQLVAPNYSPNVKGAVIDWVGGAEGLRVIDSCLGDP
jgi:hypothetical protein